MSTSETDRDADMVTARTMPPTTRGGALRRFVAMENSGTIVLIVATVIAVAWANSAWASTYEALWTTQLGIQVGAWELSHSLRDWINEGVMALFFFVAGLEIRRELDMGELRERRRLAAPVIAAVGGMIVPALLYLAINAGADSMRGWGIVVGTDTAFALGVLSLSRGLSSRVRTFLLTLVIIDDVIALTVIAVAYTDSLSPLWLLTAVAAFGLILALRAAGVRHLSVYALVAVGMWLAVSASGLHATIAGVAAGLVATAYPPGREGLRRAGMWWHRFRMAPTPELAHRASRSMVQAISPNELLRRIFHPWSSYLIVPLFALANAGLTLDGGTLSRATTLRITVGIVVGLVLGKMIGIVGSTWLASRPAFGGFPLTVAWPSLVGASAVAGIGFTMALLIADISFVGTQLEEAKLGVLAGSTLAAVLGFTVLRVVPRLPSHVRTAGAARLAIPVPDLAAPVEPEVDHILGDPNAPVMLVWYADLQCHHCASAATIIDRLRARFGADLAIAHRHLPLTDIHPHTRLAAEATEAAATQGRFRAMWGRAPGPPRRSAPGAPHDDRDRTRARYRPVHRRSTLAPPRRAHRTRHRHRGRLRRDRHPDVLHQRPTSAHSPSTSARPWPPTRRQASPTRPSAVAQVKCDCRSRNEHEASGAGRSDAVELLHQRDHDNPVSRPSCSRDSSERTALHRNSIVRSGKCSLCVPMVEVIPPPGTWAEVGD